MIKFTTFTHVTFVISFSSSKRFVLSRMNSFIVSYRVG